MTVNQALDKILTKYKSKDMDKFPDVQAAKCHLIDIKVFYGGNTPVENETALKKLIETGHNPK